MVIDTVEDKSEVAGLAEYSTVRPRDAYLRRDILVREHQRIVVKPPVASHYHHILHAAAGQVSKNSLGLLKLLC
jgi:hypothetical protein